MIFKNATVEMVAPLTELALRSKAYWGYDESLMKLWYRQLSLEADYIEHNIVVVAYNKEARIGFFSINIKEHELEDFWVEPEFMGIGAGKEMFHKVQDEMRESGIRELTIVSDPNALGFYEKMGAIKIGEVESIPEGRKLPKLKVNLTWPNWSLAITPLSGAGG